MAEKGFKRKLTAILSADAVEYSSLHKVLLIEQERFRILLWSALYFRLQLIQARRKIRYLSKNYSMTIF
jgi:hypothetical protein